MGRVLLHFGQLGRGDDAPISVRVHEPFDLANQMGPEPLMITLTDPVLADLDDTDDVIAAGQLLHQRLAQHAIVKTALDRAVGLPADHSCQILVRLEAGNPADEVPWEALYLPDTNSFAGLDSRWPMARLAGFFDPAGRQETLIGPVKVVAVLGALDRNAVPELRSILAGATASGLDVAVHVLAAEDAVEQAVEELADGRVTFEWMPDDAEALVTAIQVEHPHILHVFCHGSAQGGFMEIATRTAVQGLDPEKLVWIEADKFNAASTSTWLTVLNACEGAQRTASGRSFAYAISNKGTAATIGMRREIDEVQAHAFCRAFYHEAFAHIAQRLQPLTPLDWPAVIGKARRKLLPNGPTTMAAAGSSQWTLPVLYLGSGPVDVVASHAPEPMPDEERRRLTAMLRELEARPIATEIGPQYVELLETEIARLRRELGR